MPNCSVVGLPWSELCLCLQAKAVSIIFNTDVEEKTCRGPICSWLELKQLGPKTPPGLKQGRNTRSTCSFSL